MQDGADSGPSRLYPLDDESLFPFPLSFSFLYLLCDAGWWLVVRLCDAREVRTMIQPRGANRLATHTKCVL